MPRKKHVHLKVSESVGSEEGFISNDIKKTMTKNEKIIMGALVGGIIIFLALSILVLFSNSRKDDDSGVPTSTTGKSTKAFLTPYPTLAPVQNMTVMMNSRRFSPQSFTIPKGGLVSFFNISPDPITVESNDANSKILDLGTIESATNAEVIFDTPGTYTYRNKANPIQVGIITIK